VKINIERERKSRKFQQVIWLSHETFMWILELCGQLDEAPNVVISKLLDGLREYHLKGVFQPLKVVEKEARGYKCPFCGKGFNGSSEMIDHLSSDHKDMLKQLVGGLK
jgi:hypothetical protein